MQQVKIYRPAKNAMQSGRAKSEGWVLEAVLSTPRRPEPVMGWTSCGDTDGEVRMSFPTLEEALDFSRKSGWKAIVLPDHERKVRPRNYADNFRYVPVSAPPSLPPHPADGAPADRSRSSTG